MSHHFHSVLKKLNFKYRKFDALLILEIYAVNASTSNSTVVCLPMATLNSRIAAKYVVRKTVLFFIENLKIILNCIVIIADLSCTEDEVCYSSIHVSPIKTPSSSASGKGKCSSAA